MSNSWNVEQVWGSDRFHYEGDVAEDQIAFIIDSGIANLPDLNINTEWSKSFVDGFPDPFDDINGHGTAVASIVGAKANGEGLTGVAPGAQLVSLRVFGDRGWTSSRDLTAALKHARDVIVENNLFDKAVVNLSLGGGFPDNHPLVKEMSELGIKFTISAGNAGRDVDGYSPASYGHLDNVYVASSNMRNGFYSNFTNFDGVDINNQDDSDYSAPGSSIPTYNTDGTIGSRNGTSFSAPHLAGVLLMSEQIRPGQTFRMTDTQIAKGMVPDPLGMFDPYTYKHGPSTGEPAPEPPPESIAPIVLTPRVPEDEKMRIKGNKFDNFLTGGDNRDRIRGLKGNDTIFGFEGDDLIRGGKGDDYLDGGKGSDFITGGFGANIYADQRDGSPDTIQIKYDTYSSGVDTILGLDNFDRIAIRDVYEYQVKVQPVENDIGIFTDGNLTAIYTGDNLSVDEIDYMIFGV